MVVFTPKDLAERWKIRGVDVHTCTRHRVTGKLSVADRAARTDPTGTTPIRLKWTAETKRRFTGLRRKLVTLVGQKDVLGLNEPNGRTPQQAATDLKHWLHDQVQKEILGYKNGHPPHLEDAWTTKYVVQGYVKGVKDARANIRRAAKDSLTADNLLSATMGTVAHEGKVSAIADKSFAGLSGVTAQMEQEIAVELARGIGEGQGAMELARNLADRVDKIGLTRAETIARTELIAAHASAALTSYREAGASGVTVQAEWATAQDEAVCEECEANEGKVFDLSEAEGLIPLHPNCRCAFLPLLPDDMAVEEEPQIEPELEADPEGGITEEMLSAIQAVITGVEISGAANVSPVSAVSRAVRKPRAPKATPAGQFKNYDDGSSFLGTGSKAVTKAEELMKQGLKGQLFTPEEVAAIRGYSGSAYIDMNSALRRGISADGHTTHLIANMTSALNRASMSESVIGFRGISGRSGKALANFRVGETFTDPGFMSVSLRNKVAKEFSGGGITMEVRIPKGSKASPLDGLSNIPSETELVIQRGSRFKVLSVDEARRHVVVELIR